MAIRLLLLVAVHVGLLSVRPRWLVIDWSEPAAWVAATPPEEITGAFLRAAALLLTGSQLAALAVVGLATLTGRGQVARIARRALLPLFRAAGPIALVASSALPAVAAEVRIPITPPAVTEVVDVVGSRDSVVVRSGDSMWAIAARHVEGDPSAYWRRIVDLNRSRFTDVNLIHPGDIVLLPEISRPG